MRPFHLAFPVIDLETTEQFYVNILNCQIGRRTPTSINFNLHGHQIVAHLVTSMPDYTDGGKIDGKQVPPFHFGLVMEWEQWHEFKDHLEQLKLKGAVLYASGKSAQARGITKDQLESLGFTPATPNKLVELTFEADRVLIY